jgi:hypothetical protein
MAKNIAPAVQFSNVVFGSNDIVLVDHGKLILSIPRSDIRRILLKYGYQSERPIVQVLFGIAIFLTGLYFLVNFILQITIYRIVYGNMLLSILLFPLGSWFLIDGLRLRYYFEVALDNDTRKFPLGKNPDEDQLLEFVKQASKLGYVIDSSILNETD